MTAPDWDEMHITPRGVMHSGSRARCASSDQTPPMVEDLEREGDEDDYDLRPETARGEAS